MSHVVDQILSRWKSAFDGHQPDTLSELFTSDAVFQGFGPSVAVGREAIRTYYGAVAAGRRADVTVLRTYTIGEEVAGGFADVTISGALKPEVRMRMSLVLRLGDDGWKIRQYHVSRLVPQD